MERYILSVLVEDKPGVMQRVSGLFRRRNFNIDSITVGHSEKKGVSRITLTVAGDRKILEQVMKQLNKLIEVVKVSELSEKESVVRELALVKVRTKNESVRSELISYANIFRGRIVDVSKNSMIIEITGDSEKIDAFIDLVKIYGILELARTGITAMIRGAKREVKK
ncbi:MAG: acetolactate synthase small subunit [Candidatus Hydrothermarchaeota archaeon]|nr:MAG: acetolactate synthase small subunit [Candidatus Hydrothermarchaeota archaeon]